MILKVWESPRGAQAKRKQTFITYSICMTIISAKIPESIEVSHPFDDDICLYAKGPPGRACVFVLQVAPLGKLHVLPGASHWIQNECPDEVCAGACRGGGVWAGVCCEQCLDRAWG